MCTISTCLEYIDQGFADVEDRYLATSTNGEPFCGKSSCHAVPPTELELVLLRFSPSCDLFIAEFNTNSN